MQTMDVPYPKGYEKQAVADLKTQANKIASDIVNSFDAEAIKIKSKQDWIVEIEKKEIVALIAYLQRLGTDIKTANNNN
jgi:cytochrome c oxidase cbb3-type subunit I/II